MQDFVSQESVQGRLKSPGENEPASGNLIGFVFKLFGCKNAPLQDDGSPDNRVVVKAARTDRCHPPLKSVGVSDR